MIKIRINCTSIEDLRFEDVAICGTTFPLFQFTLHFNLPPFIQSVCILHKNSHRFTTKTLEFICSRPVAEVELISFINTLNAIGFRSNTNTKVVYRDDIDYTYRFNGQLEPTFTRKNSRYSTEWLIK